MTEKAKIDLGMKVKCVVSGFVGIATGKSEFLNGCVRIMVTPPVDKDGKSRDCEWFDVDQLQVVAEKTPARTLYTSRVPSGGPRDDARRGPDAKR